MGWENGLNLKKKTLLIDIAAKCCGTSKKNQSLTAELKFKNLDNKINLIFRYSTYKWNKNLLTLENYKKALVLKLFAQNILFLIFVN